MSVKLTDLKRELKQLGNPEKKVILQRFFKTGPGEYAAGDIFLGITVPEQRKVVRKYHELGLADLKKLLTAPYHEFRLVALLILIHQFRRQDPAGQKQIHELYLAHTAYINNWDLVDLSAEHLVGAYLAERSLMPLKKLARSQLLWERRIAIIATFHFIKQGDAEPTLQIAALLLDDEHDLIHKAVGWMLREVGKRCSQAEEERFLEQYAATMPRTMLRYAIERFSPEKRRRYLQMKRR
jgi:3-methyladenine DNA glycosylase AlkD